MKNRNMPAKPVWTEDMNLGDTAGAGLTKLEYAAIHIMASASNSEFTSLGRREQVDWAVTQANELFNELDKQEKE